MFDIGDTNLIFSDDRAHASSTRWTSIDSAGSLFEAANYFEHDGLAHTTRRVQTTDL